MAAVRAHWGTLVAANPALSGSPEPRPEQLQLLAFCIFCTSGSFRFENEGQMCVCVRVMCCALRARRPRASLFLALANISRISVSRPSPKKLQGTEELPQRMGMALLSTGRSQEVTPRAVLL